MEKANVNGQDPPIRVLVTGFGTFQNVKENPSWKIVSKLPNAIEHKWLNICIFTPSAPTKSAYHDIFDTIPNMLEETKPDIVLHVGLDVERTFFGVERGAARDGYDQYPDVQRKVFTRAETKRVWEKSPARLDSSLDLERVLRKWHAGVGKGVDVRCSDDVGKFVCGFLYYTSMQWFWKQNPETMPVAFLHVPLLPNTEAMNIGTAAVIALIRALAECC